MNRGWPIALALSALAHAALAVALSRRAPSSAPKSSRGLSFRGTTFEVETVFAEANDPLNAAKAGSNGQADASNSSSEESSAGAEAESSRTTEPTPTGQQRNVDVPFVASAEEGGLPSKVDQGTRAVDVSLQHQSSDSARGSRGTYGQSGAERGLLDLHRAFLKTLPLTAQSDPAWTQLPFGMVGRVKVRLTVGEDLQLAPVDVVEDPTEPAPAILQRLVQRNRSWLFTQRFTIGPQKASGVQVLRITATLSREAPDPDTPEAPGTRALGVRGGETPTGSYLTYFSGRHLELEVERLPSDDLESGDPSP